MTDKSLSVSNRNYFQLVNIQFNNLHLTLSPNENTRNENGLKC
jgi:hypothetical protein